MIESKPEFLPRPAISRAMRDELFRKVFEESSIGMAFTGLDGQMLKANEHLGKMLGYSPRELAGKNFSELTHPEDVSLSRAFFNDLVQNPNRSYRLEKRYIHKTGVPVWAEVTATLLCDSNEDPLFVVAQMHDFSARKTFEEEQKIIIGLLDIIGCSTTWEDMLKRCTAHLKTAFGVKSVGIRLRRGDDFSTWTEKSGMPECLIFHSGNPALDRLATFIMESSIYPELPHFTRAGSFWANSKAEMINDGLLDSHEDSCPAEDFESLAFIRLRTKNKTYGFIQILDPLRGRFSKKKIEFLERLADQVSLDLVRRLAEHNLNRSEKLFRLLAENANDTIYRFCMLPEKKFEYISPSVERFSGYSPEEIYANPLMILDVINPEFSDTLNEVLQRPQDFEEPFRLKWIHKDGRAIWAEHWHSTVYDESGSIMAVEGIARDITAQVETEKLILASKAKFYKAFHSNPNPMVIIKTGSWNIIETNSIFSRITGFGKAEAAGQTLCELGIFRNADEPSAIADEIARSGKLVEREIELKVRNSKKEFAVVSAVKIEIDGEEHILVSTEIITKRKLAQLELQQRGKELEDKTRSLEEVNTALRVLLRQREEDRTELEKVMRSNINRLIVPYLESLKKTGLSMDQKSHIDILEKNINTIFSPLTRILNSATLNLTPRETQIANLVREGKTNKEIGKLLRISTKAVEFHRHKIRQKLGIASKKVNLLTALASLENTV